ncbi:MAG: DPP IV N-terminal domain-containing protein, partial [Pirellula sp.]
GRWMSVECGSGAQQPFDRPKRLVDALSKLDAFKNGHATSFLQRIQVFDPKFENALIEHKGDYFLFQLGKESSATDTVRQVTHSPNQTKELAELSPSGQHLAFIHEQNIWVAHCDSTEVKKLTNDGGGEILNGKLDWVYQEEIYGRGQFKGYWWSPDGEWIAYLKLDETPVPRFRIDNSLTFAQTIEETRYPKSGQPNPSVSLHAVHVVSAQHIEIPLNEYPTDDRLVVRVGWNANPGKVEVVFQMQNRIQSKLDVCAFDLTTKESRKLTQETSPAWVDVLEEPRWLPDGSFLWLSDAAAGRRHLFRIGTDGSRIAITQGDWDVKSIEAISKDGKQVWLLGRRSSPVNSDLLRIDLDSNKMETLGESTGSHRVSVHPKCNYYLDFWSDANTPSQLWLRDASGKKLRFVGSNRSDRLDYLKAAQVELFEIKARDGFCMQSLMYKPIDFTARAHSHKLPVLIYVYGGPAAPSVENTWNRRNDLWHRYLAEKGICVLLCDNRSALGRGNTDTWKIYKDMGSTELRDLEDAVAWLGQQPWVDTDRIGMWGWSYGGYFTSYAMTHSKLFRAGIAGAPVTDWNNYDSVYTERYMDTPKANPEGYRSSSVVTAAPNLHGRLMLIHGEIDDNVHMANTMQLVHALQKANKQFDLMVYPNNRHGLVDPDQVYHQYQMMTRFFEEHLLGIRNFGIRN